MRGSVAGQNRPGTNFFEACRGGTAWSQEPVTVVIEGQPKDPRTFRSPEAAGKLAAASSFPEERIANGTAPRMRLTRCAGDRSRGLGAMVQHGLRHIPLITLKMLDRATETFDVRRPSAISSTSLPAAICKKFSWPRNLRNPVVLS